MRCECIRDPLSSPVLACDLESTLLVRKHAHDVLPKFGESGSEMSSRNRSECSRLRCVKPILTGKTVSFGARECLVHATGRACLFSWTTCEPSGELAPRPLRLSSNKLETRIFSNMLRTWLLESAPPTGYCQHYVDRITIAAMTQSSL